MKKIILVLSVISTLALAGCSLSETQVNNDLQESVNNEQQEITNSGEENKEQTQKELVTEIKYQENIRIPKVNLDSEDAKKVNEDLENIAKEEIQVFGDLAHNISYKYSKNLTLLNKINFLCRQNQKKGV